MKKTLSITLVMLVIILMLTGCTKSGNGGNKPSNVRKENPASDFVYHVSENKALIKEYKGKGKDVVIPEKIEDSPVVAIATGAFASTDIESVDIPDTVTTIFDLAFAPCESLHTVKMGNGVADIGSGAFRGCKKLKNLTLSTSLTKIRTEAFKGCESLETLYIPKSVTEWGQEAFFKCPISSLTFEDGIKSIGSYACFWGSTFEEITIPSSVEQLGEYTFHDNLEKAIFLGNAPKEIGKQPLGEKATIYCGKDTVGWDNSNLERYPIVYQ